MRYEFTKDEWTDILPLLPTKPRGVPRLDDRRILDGILLGIAFGRTAARSAGQLRSNSTCYNRFVRRRRAGSWDKSMAALTVPNDAAEQMIDTSIVRVHQHAACTAGNRGKLMGRS
jgi:transposase